MDQMCNVKGVASGYKHPQQSIVFFIYLFQVSSFFFQPTLPNEPQYYLSYFFFYLCAFSSARDIFFLRSLKQVEY